MGKGCNKAPTFNGDFSLKATSARTVSGKVSSDKAGYSIIAIKDADFNVIRIPCSNLRSLISCILIYQAIDLLHALGKKCAFKPRLLPVLADPTILHADFNQFRFSMLDIYK